MEVCSGKVECKVSAKRLWQAYYVDAHNCLPKASPHVFSHLSYDDSARGFSHAGCSRTFHFQKSYAERIAKEGNTEHLMLYLKEKLEEIDHQALKLKLEIVEGGAVGTLVKKIKETVHIKDGDTPNTCVVNWSYEYEALSENHKPLFVSIIQEKVPQSYKEVEEYLLSHDDYKKE